MSHGLKRADHKCIIHDVDLCEDEVGLRSFLNGKLVVLLIKSTLLWILMEDFIITHTRKRKKKVSVVSLCTSEDKQTYLYPDSLLPLSPISGCIFCYIMRQVLNKASQWKSSSRSNQRRGSMYHRLAGRKGQ